MRCPKCQAEINSNSKFCTKCGCNLEAEMAKAVKSAGPIKLAKPIKPTEPIEPAEPIKPAGPIKLAKPIEPAEPIKPAGPIKLAKPIKPAEPIEPAEPIKPAAPVGQAVCAKCGASLAPGTRFCIKCGTPNMPQANAPAPSPVQVPPVQPSPMPVQPSPVQAPPVQPSPMPVPPVQPSPVQAPPVQPSPVQVPPVQPSPMPVPPISNNSGKKSRNNKQQQGGKSGNGLIIAIAVLSVLVAISGAACFLVWNGTISLPSFSKSAKNTDKNDEDESSADASEKDSEDKSFSKELMSEADKLLEEGKQEITVSAEIINGMDTLRSAMEKYDEIAQEAGDKDIVADKIAEVYESYVQAVINHKGIMDGQELSGSIYSQIMIEMKDAETLANELTDKGYTVDTSTLMSEKDAFVTSYTERVIQKFDEFTTRDAWSRTESWNLMSGFEGMFDSDDLDNPVRLRYAYALSWWQQKQMEIELANGTITKKGAAIKIANMIETMDYNPMMINYYITYMKASGENCTDVANAYNDILSHVQQTQGIRIGTDMPLEKFWYFNDFGQYSVDSTNGVTVENRQWIRDRMSGVAFAKQ